MHELALIKTLSLGYLLGLVSLSVAALVWQFTRPRLAPTLRADAGFALIGGTFVLTSILALVIWAGVVREIIYMSTHHFHALMYGGWGSSITAAGFGVLAASLLIAWIGWLRGRVPKLRGGEAALHSGLTVKAHDGVTTAGLIGCWRPQVWVNPTWWSQLSDAEREMALFHERCHLLRRDNQRKLALQSIAALYAVLPFTRRWVRDYELDCELAVDDACRRNLPEAQYTDLVARSASFVLTRPALASGLTLSDMRQRLAMLTSPRRHASTRAGLALALGLAVAATLPVGALLGHELSRCLLACYLGY